MIVNIKTLKVGDIFNIEVYDDSSYNPLVHYSLKDLLAKYTAIWYHHYLSLYYVSFKVVSIKPGTVEAIDIVSNIAISLCSINCTVDLRTAASTVSPVAPPPVLAPPIAAISPTPVNTISFQNIDDKGECNKHIGATVKIRGYPIDKEGMQQYDDADDFDRLCEIHNTTNSYVFKIIRFEDNYILLESIWSDIRGTHFVFDADYNATIEVISLSDTPTTEAEGKTYKAQDNGMRWEQLLPNGGSCWTYHSELDETL